METVYSRHSSNSQDAALPTRRRRGGTGMAQVSLTSLRSPTAEARASEARQCGCKSCRGDHFTNVRAVGVTDSTRVFETQGEGATPSRRNFLSVAPVVQPPQATGLSPVKCRCKSGREQTWSVNRTSEPGPVANGIEPRRDAPVWGASPPRSAIHFLLFCSRSPTSQRHGVESAASAGATPAASTNHAVSLNHAQRQSPCRKTPSHHATRTRPFRKTSPSSTGPRIDPTHSARLETSLCVDARHQRAAGCHDTDHDSRLS